MTNVGIAQREKRFLECLAQSIADYYDEQLAEVDNPYFNTDEAKEVRVRFEELAEKVGDDELSAEEWDELIEAVRYRDSPWLTLDYDLTDDEANKLRHKVKEQVKLDKDT